MTVYSTTVVMAGVVRRIGVQMDERRRQSAQLQAETDEQHEAEALHVCRIVAHIPRVVKDAGPIVADVLRASAAAAGKLEGVEGNDQMAQPPPKNVDEYIASFPRAAQEVLERVRSTIRKAVPGAEEAISYRIPTYKLHGRYVIYFAGWKQHYSLYPANERLVSAFKKDLAPYEVNDKGTIRFPLSEPVPVKLVAGIAKFRAREVAELEQEKGPARKKR